jgi:hypothetical protein
MIIISGLIPLALLLVVAWLCVRTLRRAVSIPAHLLRGERCGRCAYELGGVDTANCPECGAELDVVGVVTPVMQLNKRPGGVAAALAWTVLAFVLTVLSIAAISIIGGPGIYDASIDHVRTRSILAPRAQGVTRPDAPSYEVQIETDVIAHRDGELLRGTIRINVAGPTGDSSVEMDAASLEMSNGAFDHTSALDLMAAAGLDAESEFIQSEAEQLVQLAASVRSQPDDHPDFAMSAPNGMRTLTPRSRSTMISDARPSNATIAVLVILALWIVGWAFGMLTINRRRRALYTRAAAAEPG